MGLTLITGRAHAGKSGLIRSHLLSGLADGKETVLLLPTFADVARAREELSSVAPVGLMATTFDTWIKSMWARFGDGRRLVAPVVRRELMRRALAHVPSEDASLPATEGVEDLLAGVAARSAGFPRTVGHDPVYQSIDRALKQYESTLSEAGLIEPAAAAMLLPMALNGMELCIAANRFTDISAAQERCLLELAGENEVAVAVLWEGGFAATEAATELVDRLIACESTHVHVDAPEAHDELGLLEEQLFDPRSPVESAGGVILSEAGGPEAEAAAIAAAVARAMEGGVAPSRIAVVFRDLGSRARHIDLALRARAVDPAIDMAAELGQTALGDAVSTLLRVSGGSASRGELLHFLRGPFSDAPAGEVDALDARWRRSRTEYGQTLLAEAGRLTPGLSGIVRTLRALGSGPQVQESGNNWQDFIDSLFTVARGGGTGPDYVTRLDEAAGRVLVESAAALADAGLDIEAERLYAAVRRLPVAVGHVDRPETVLVTEAHRLRSRRFDVVVVGGLTASEFSSEKPEPLGAAVLRGLGLSAGTEERLSERLLFYAIVTRARRRLELVRQAADSNGSGLRASVFWEEVADVYRTPEQVREGDAAGLPVAHLISLSDLPTTAPAVTVGRDELRQLARRGQLPAPRVRRGALGPHRCSAALEDELSVTEVEAYLSCPYKWFYQRIVRPRELDREFGVAERGALTHLILSEFYARFRSAGDTRVEPQSLMRARALLAEVSAELVAAAMTKTRGLAEELSVRTAQAWAHKAVEADAELLIGFEPVDCEWEFGDRAGAPFELGGVRLRGTVDRVERGGSGLIVTDYKSGQVSGQTSFATEGLLQAVAYAAAAERIREGKCIAGVYRSLRSGALRGFWNGDLAMPEAWVSSRDVINDERWQELVAWATDSVGRAADGIRSGHIEPAPLNRRSCAYCSAAAFCERGLE